MNIKAVSINETKQYKINPEDQEDVLAIHGVYCYDPDSTTYCCELTPSHDLQYLYTYLTLSSSAQDNYTRREELFERYCNEPGEDIYMHVSDVQALRQQKECGTFEDMEEAHEYLQGNCPF
jgi:hypothetical protein